MFLLLWKKSKPFRIWTQVKSVKLVKICVRLCSSCYFKAVLTEMCPLKVKNIGGSPEFRQCLGCIQACLWALWTAYLTGGWSAQCAWVSWSYYELQVAMPFKIMPWSQGKADFPQWILTIIVTDTANGPPSMKQHFLVCALQQRYQC